MHGLGADPEYTWTARREGKGFDRVAWLKDFLSQRFPQARIMVFNHNADRLHNAPRKTPLEPARDLVAEMKKLQGNEVSKARTFTYSYLTPRSDPSSSLDIVSTASSSSR